jgi:DNA-binding CsgD family transcriptional regulator
MSAGIQAQDRLPEGDSLDRLLTELWNEARFDSSFEVGTIDSVIERYKLSTPLDSASKRTYGLLEFMKLHYFLLQEDNENSVKQLLFLSRGDFPLKLKVNAYLDFSKILAFSGDYNGARKFIAKCLDLYDTDLQSPDSTGEISSIILVSVFLKELEYCEYGRSADLDTLLRLNNELIKRYEDGSPLVLLHKLVRIGYDISLTGEEKAKYYEEANAYLEVLPSPMNGLHIRYYKYFLMRGDSLGAFEQMDEFFRVHRSKFERKVNSRTMKFLMDYGLLLSIFAPDEKKLYSEIQELLFEFRTKQLRSYQSFRNLKEWEYLLLDVEGSRIGILEDEVEGLQARNRNLSLLLGSLGFVLLFVLFALVASLRRSKIIRKEIRKSMNETFVKIDSILDSIDTESESEESGVEGPEENEPDQQLHPETVEYFLSRLFSKYEGLTNTDAKVLWAVKKGMSNKQIAEELFISLKGVESARYRVRKKMGLSGKDNLYEVLQSL